MAAKSTKRKRSSGSTKRRRTGSKLFGAKIAAARRKLGLTQDQLAERVGVNQSQIAQYESGSVAPSFDALCRLASVLGENLDFLVDSQAVANELKTIETVLFEKAPEEGLSDLGSIPKDALEEAARIFWRIVLSSRPEKAGQSQDHGKDEPDR